MLSNRRRLLVTLWIMILAISWAGTTQAWDPEDLPAINEHLEIGPMPGLTTSWHAAPLEVTVPLDAEIMLRVPLHAGRTVTWFGAEEILNDGNWSVAQPASRQIGNQEITVRSTSEDTQFVDDTVFEESIQITRSSVPSDQISVTPPTVWISPVEIDKKRLNDSTYHYYRGESIAELEPLAADFYRTSTDRTIWLLTDVTPAEFAPLIEWRLSNGEAYLGNPAQIAIYEPGEHQLRLGPVGSAEQLRLETYSTRITSHSLPDRIPDGVWTTFRAETEPPGFESEITWLASTRHGTTTRIMHRGPEFEVRFDDTFGDNGFQWLGVKANEATFGQDQRGVDVRSCTPPTGEAGTVLDITGTGFPDDPDDVCMVLMPDSKVAARAFASDNGQIMATVGGVVEGAEAGQWFVVRGEGGTAPIPDSRAMSGTPDAWAFEGAEGEIFEDSCPETFTPIATPEADTVVGFDFVPCDDCFSKCAEMEGSLEAIVPVNACPSTPPNGYPVGTELDIDVHFDVRCDAPSCGQTHFDCFAPSLTVLQPLSATDVARELADKLEQCFLNQGITDLLITHASDRIVVFKPDCELLQGGGSIVIRPAGC